MDDPRACGRPLACVRCPEIAVMRLPALTNDDDDDAGDDDDPVYDRW